jgi:hypothetical protein
MNASDAILVVPPNTVETETELEPDIVAFGPIISALRANFATELANMPKRHSKQTPQCIPMSRFLAVTVDVKSQFTAEEQAHFAVCEFCRNNLTRFTRPLETESPATNEDTLPIAKSAVEDTLKIKK